MIKKSSTIFLHTVLLLAYLLIFSDAKAQQQAVLAEYFTETDGLSNRAVRCIIKDGYGVLWVGTMYGLNRFDGRDFRHFTTEQGLKGNAIARLRKLNKRYLLLFYGDGETNDFPASRLHVFDVLTQKTVKWETVAHLFPFRYSDIEAVEASNRDLNVLFYLKNGKHFFCNAEAKFTEIQGLSPTLQFVAQIKNGEHWAKVLNEDSLVVLRRSEQGRTLQRVNLGYVINGSLCFLGTATDGSCYFGVMFHGALDKNYIVRVSASGKSQTVRDFSFSTGTERVNLASIIQHPVTKNYWAMNDEKAILFSEYWETICEVPQPLPVGDLDKNMVSRQSYFDGNTIWQPSFSGFYKVDFYKPQFETIFRFNPVNGARGMLRVKDKLLINAEYTHEYDLKTKQFRVLEGNRVGLAIDLDPNGNVWTGNYGRFYYRTADLSKIKNYNNTIREIWSIWANTNTGIWLGGKGLECFNPLTETFESINFQKFPEMKAASVYHFQPLTATKVWLATSLGLYELNPKTRKITARYWSGGKGKYYLPFDDLRHLHLEKDKKTVWLATGGKGFLRWQPQSGDIKAFSLANNEANIVQGILPDNYGFLWLSTEKGLVQFDPKTEQLRIYTTKDGLVVDEFNRASHFRDTDGTLYFGSIDGIAVVRPERFKNAFLQTTKKSLFVVEVQQYIGIKRRVEERTEQWATQGKLTLNPTDRFFTLTLGVRDYSYTKDAAYFYQIKGYDKEWIAAENQRITFGRLPYGRRTILAKALLSNGQYSEILEIPIFVKRPFYLTWWFILLLLVLSASIVYWRLNDLRKRNLFLEKEVAQRTESIQQAKEIVEAQAEELRTLDKMKSRFFANISHELRTPLTLITAPLQQLITQEYSAGKKQLVQIAFNNSQRLLRLVNQILDLTKLENTELKLETQAVVLLPFVQGIVAEFESFAVHKGVALNLHFDLNENEVYTIDTNKVETILYNLLSNALKFTPKGGEVRLSIRQKKEEELWFEVKDTGRGIAAEDLPHVFDRFYQSKLQNTAEGGTGIGLAICKEFADLMNGKLAAESVYGAGSTFSFGLPLQTVKTSTPTLSVVERPEPHAADRAQQGEPQQDESLPFILLVEDNLDLQTYTQLALSPYYRVQTANDGKQALAFLEAITDDELLPDLILSDIMMPEMDGWQLLQHLKAAPRYKKILVVMLTARAGAEDKLQALRLGVDDYLTKPFLQEELKARLRNLIERGSIRRQSFEQLSKIEKEQTEDVNLEEDTELSPEIDTDEWLLEVEKYILENLQNPQLSVQSVADAFELSRFSFNRRLQLAAGMNPTDYIQELRLNEAKRLLETKVFLTVKEAVFAVGASNPKIFSRKFFQRFGRYPSEYL